MAGRPATLRFNAPSLDMQGASGPGSVGQPARTPARGGIILRNSLSPAQAFTQEMNEEADRSRKAAMFGTITEDMPHLLEDDFIQRERADVAESVIGSAFEAALGVAIMGDVRKGHGVTVRPAFTTVERGIHVDASPSWTFRRMAPRSQLRVDIPLIPNSFRIHSWKDLRGTDRQPQRIGAGVSVDPFDETVRATFTFQF